MTKEKVEEIWNERNIRIEEEGEKERITEAKFHYDKLLNSVEKKENLESKERDNLSIMSFPSKTSEYDIENSYCSISKKDGGQENLSSDYCVSEFSSSLTNFEEKLNDECVIMRRDKSISHNSPFQEPLALYNSPSCSWDEEEVDLETGVSPLKIRSGNFYLEKVFQMRYKDDNESKYNNDNINVENDSSNNQFMRYDKSSSSILNNVEDGQSQNNWKEDLIGNRKDESSHLFGENNIPNYLTCQTSLLRMKSNSNKLVKTAFKSSVEDIASLFFKPEWIESESKKLEVSNLLTLPSEESYIFPSSEFNEVSLSNSSNNNFETAQIGENYHNEYLKKKVITSIPNEQIPEELSFQSCSPEKSEDTISRMRSIRTSLTNSKSSLSDTSSTDGLYEKISMVSVPPKSPNAHSHQISETCQEIIAEHDDELETLLTPLDRRYSIDDNLRSMSIYNNFFQQNSNKSPIDKSEKNENFLYFDISPSIGGEKQPDESFFNSRQINSYLSSSNIIRSPEVESKFSNSLDNVEINSELDQKLTSRSIRALDSLKGNKTNDNFIPNLDTSNDKWENFSISTKESAKMSSHAKNISEDHNLPGIYALNSPPDGHYQFGHIGKSSILHDSSDNQYHSMNFVKGGEHLTTIQQKFYSVTSLSPSKIKIRTPSSNELKLPSVSLNNIYVSKISSDSTSIKEYQTANYNSNKNINTMDNENEIYTDISSPLFNDVVSPINTNEKFFDLDIVTIEEIETNPSPSQSNQINDKIGNSELSIDNQETKEPIMEFIDNSEKISENESTSPISSNGLEIIQEIIPSNHSSSLSLSYNEPLTTSLNSHMTENCSEEQYKTIENFSSELIDKKLEAQRKLSGSYYNLSESNYTIKTTSDFSDNYPTNAHSRHTNVDQHLWNLICEGNPYGSFPVNLTDSSDDFQENESRKPTLVNRFGIISQNIKLRCDEMKKSIKKRLPKFYKKDKSKNKKKNEKHLSSNNDISFSWNLSDHHHQSSNLITDHKEVKIYYPILKNEISNDKISMKFNNVIDEMVKEDDIRNVSDKLSENIRYPLKTSKSIYATYDLLKWHDELLPATYLYPLITLCKKFEDYETDNDNYIHIYKFKDLLKRFVVNSMKLNFETLECLTEGECASSKVDDRNGSILTFELLEKYHGEYKEISDDDFDAIFHRTFQLLLNASQTYIHRDCMEVFVKRASKLLENRLVKYTNKFMKDGLITLEAVINILIHCNETTEMAIKFILPFAKYLHDQDCGGNVLKRAIHSSTVYDVYLFGIC
ncbi:hypothetical protein SNEBB_000008 [Seison nebaliae]|nr:hypothetical protein SNEBB_000008 [Seison nebaliae]